MRPLWLFRCLTRLGISAIVVVSVSTLVNPHLNPDVPLWRHRFGEAVINLCLERAQRYRARTLLFTSGHFRSTEPTRHLNLDALGTGIHRLLERSFIVR